MRIAISLSVLALLLAQGCAFVDGLREDVYEEEMQAQRKAQAYDYASPENRNMPPPPATAFDDRAAAVAGTPIDYSGERAKSGRVTKKDFYSESARNENSLWSEDGQNNYLFSQNKLKVPGDLLTVFIEDELRRDMVGEVKLLLPPEYRNEDIEVPGLTKDKAAGPAGPGAAPAAPAAQAGANGQNGQAQKELDPSDMMTAEVLERFPNGNLRIRGIKRIPFRTQTRNLEVLAIVKSSDIDEKDVVKSSRFFEHRVEMYK